jgi:hypothetical protein
VIEDTLVREYVADRRERGIGGEDEELHTIDPEVIVGIHFAICSRVPWNIATSCNKSL